MIIRMMHVNELRANCELIFKQTELGRDEKKKGNKIKMIFSESLIVDGQQTARQGN